MADSARPDRSGFILSRLGAWKSWTVFLATPTGAKFDAPTFDDLKTFCVENNVGIVFVELETANGDFTGRGWQNTFGPEAFMDAVRSGEDTDALWKMGTRAGSTQIV